MLGRQMHEQSRLPRAPSEKPSPAPQGPQPTLHPCYPLPPADPSPCCIPTPSSGPHLGRRTPPWACHRARGGASGAHRRTCPVVRKSRRAVFSKDSRLGLLLGPTPSSSTRVSPPAPPPPGPKLPKAWILSGSPLIPSRTCKPGRHVRLRSNRDHVGGSPRDRWAHALSINEAETLTRLFTVHLGDQK